MVYVMDKYMVHEFWTFMIFFVNFYDDIFPTGETQKMNLFQSLTNAMDTILDSDPTAGTLISFCYYSQLSLRQTPSGPAPTVRLREVSGL